MNENAKLLENLRNAPAKEKTTPTKDDITQSDAQLKLQAAEDKIAQLEEKLKECRTSQKDYELQNVELQNLKIKMEKLESERALWEEGKQLVARAAKASELEKELNVARDTITVLRESVRGKLLLEEQMASITKRYIYYLE